MWLGRRKPTIAGELFKHEPETRRRNRLSKPLTNKLSANISTTSVQETAIHNKDASTQEPVLGGPLTSHPSNPALRRQIRSQIFDEETPSPNRSLTSDSALSLTYTVSEIDKNTVQPDSPQEQHPPASSLKPKKRKSFVLRPLSTRRSTSLACLNSDQQADPPNGDEAAASTPMSSLDRIVDSPAIPPTRRASFTPGTATRKPSPIIPEREIQEEHGVEELEERNLVETNECAWHPPPPRMAGRAETPADLDYSHLGVLRLGSLQIVNGRASPAFSEASKLSKQVLAFSQSHRDVSSDYGEAQEELQELLISRSKDLSLSTPDENSEHRTLSWDSTDEKPSAVHDLENFESVLYKAEVDKEDDQTSLMAKEYMAELPARPFSNQKSRHLSGSSRRSEESMQTSLSLTSLQPSLSSDGDAESSSPMFHLQRCPSSTGSVIRRSRKGTETVEPRQIFPGSGIGDEHQPCESTLSWYSPDEPSFTRGEAFRSPLEFEAQRHQAFPASSPNIQPPHPAENSDSGYSSTHSLRSLQMAKSPPFAVVQPLRDASATRLNGRTTQSECRSSGVGHVASILKSRKTEPAFPNFANLRPAPVSTNSAPVVPTPDTAVVKQVKIRKKLQKKRPHSQPPGALAIPRVHSFEGDSIPRVPSQAEDNLRIRSQEVPELEKTYIPLNGMSHYASTSSIDLQEAEVRFPSPVSEESIHVRRSRSRSRPLSWISRSKEDGMSSRRNSCTIPPETMAVVHDFGAAYSLGGGPYDLAHENLVYRQPPNLYETPAITPRPRPMMDDKAAAEFARRRSRSIQERDSMWADRTSVFNDRGGIPGKHFRPASLARDAPPITPEMLQKAYRTSSGQRQVSIGNGFAPPPPPPPHSPRPAYVEYEEDYSDMPIAPPPPSHSPRPVDMMPDPWTAQSTAWQAPRESSENVGDHQYWDSGMYEGYQLAVEDKSEPLYPDIPPRGGRHWQPSRQTPQDYYYSEQHYYEGFNNCTQYGQQGYSPYEGSCDYSNHCESRYTRQSQRSSVLQEIQQPRGRAAQSYGQAQHRPLPSPRTSGGASPRPHSQAGSFRSFASSLAEELHPSDLERPCPPPEFGRYSGGMGFGYERENGFGGSAGTRSVSGKAGAMRKGVALRASFGVDLSDVPVIMAVVRA
ncbi:hypothetical protein A1O3_08758 [Capronia epimyces CBS 606.96]|uniref:Uncharacterized protein n=1 Tax=Capronia epimyces CBS 606.96 TaxID=1182542 RepID=W9XFH3_9EURO|nr:uncharacterized protein A1O3_08758 [Capronia epimyces CBS 606.96]EXJ79257.1 hypothetical protein A1O3_08758 [Capronia epimyces CBS 606.96]